MNSDLKLVLETTAKFAKARLDKDASGHDGHHLERVRSLANRLAREEGADEFVCEMAALLHEVADPKLVSPERGKMELQLFLDTLPITENVRQKISFIAMGISFGKSLAPDKNSPEALGIKENNFRNSSEFLVVQDADRLDAMGAVGIARCFAYGGFHHRPMHVPNQKPRGLESEAHYREGSAGSLNHFHEKLLTLRDRMNTQSGKAFAQDRHAFLQEFVTRFTEEWDGRR